MEFANVYEDVRRAAAYAKLEFPGTYYLAYRDLPELISRHIEGTRAIDFGCGTGRSTRFLQKLGFEVSGVDIAEDMIRQAHVLDPNGDYHLITEGDLSEFPSGAVDLILSAFTFDNIPTAAQKVQNLKAISALLKTEGAFINLVSSPDIYVHEWASFSTKDFPENKQAKSGDKVRIIMTDVEDSRPVEDIVWSDEAYRDLYQQAALSVVRMHSPLAMDSEPFEWVSETKIPPWIIYVLVKV